ncbi:MAG: DUF2339 domain-containing protein [Actinomycetia bacterium]|nr:DUF2339 domain-containing protein [Actinomycetes bacterium]
MEDEQDEPHGSDSEALDARVAKLELRLSRMEAALGLDEIGPVPSATHVPPPPRARDRVPPAGPISPPFGPPPTTPPPPRVAETTPRTWPDAEILLKWAGLLLVFLAAVFAVSTAIERGWIGPELQLAGAVTGGLALIAGGLHLDRIRPEWGHALVHAGLGVLFTTAGAAHGWLDLAPLWSAGVGGVVVGLGGLALARHLDREELGFTAVFGFLLVPFSLHVWDTWSPSVLVIGLTLTTLVATGLALERRWDFLRVAVTVTAVFGIFAMAGWAGADGTAADRLTTGASAALLAALWWAMPILILWRAASALQVSAGVPTSSDLRDSLQSRLTLLIPPWIWSIAAVLWFDDDSADAGLFALALAAGFLGLALVSQPWCRRSHWLGQLVGVSVLATIGLALVASGDVLWLSLTAQAVGLLFLARATDDELMAVNGGLMAAVVGVVVAARMVEAVDVDAALAADLTNLVIIVVLAVAAFLFGPAGVERGLGGVTLGAVMLWILSVLVHLPQGHVMVSVAWSAIGIGILLAGAVLQRTNLGTAGLAVLAVTMVKLLTVDLAEVDTFWRAGLFLLIGAGLLRLGYSLPALTQKGSDP